MSIGSLDDLEPPWAQLVAIETEESDDLIPIVGDQFSIGRGKGESILLKGAWFVCGFAHNLCHMHVEYVCIPYAIVQYSWPVHTHYYVTIRH